MTTNRNRKTSEIKVLLNLLPDISLRVVCTLLCLKAIAHRKGDISTSVMAAEMAFPHGMDTCFATKLQSEKLNSMTAMIMAA